MLDRVVLLGILLLVFSITPVSALEMGSIENTNLPMSKRLV